VKKKVVIIPMIILAGLLIYFYLSAIEIYQAVRYAFLTDDGYDEYLAANMTPDIFQSVSRNNYQNLPYPNKKELDLWLIFSINNLVSDGIVWMDYSFVIKDERNGIFTGSWGVPIRLSVKRNGWQIVEMHEPP
jgi:hypothetical protein